MAEQVTKLLDENFGENFTIGDQVKKRRSRSRTVSPKPPCPRANVEGRVKEHEKNDGKAEEKAPEVKEAVKRVARPSSKVRAPKIVVTMMAKK